MASGSTVSGDAGRESVADSHAVASDYIEGQLAKTSSEVRLIEISSAVLMIAIAISLYLLVLGVIDHWFAGGGISAVVRTLCLFVLLVALAVYIRKRLFPYLRYRISLPYAAHTIEQSEPRLKNSLLNFLFLRRQKKGVPQVVLQGLERQAATGLTRTSVDLAIERRKLVHLGIAMVAVILAGGLYTVLSPKSLLPAVERMLVPWADIDAASRVKIGEIEVDGKEIDFRAEATRSIPVVLRSLVKVSAEIKGLGSGESAAVLFSSGGGGEVDQRAAMQFHPDDGVYIATLPPNEEGIFSDMTCRLEAGDARSKTFELKLIPAPSFQIESVEYVYPPYTGLGSRIEQGVGDLRAIEGTEVRLRAQSTEEIGVAAIHLEADHAEWNDKPVRMDVEGRHAEGRFQMRRKLFEGDSVPEFTEYYLFLKTPAGKTNHDVVRHQISTLLDQAPVVEMLDPRVAVIEVREDGRATFEIRGRDPDFRLAELWLIGAFGDEERFKIDLLNEAKRVGEPLRTVHRETVEFVPREVGLRAGETVSVFGVGIDNKQPSANRTETPRVRLRILPPTHKPQQSPDNENKEKSGTKSKEEKSADESSDSRGGDASQDSSTANTSETQDAGQEGTEKEEADSGQQGNDGKQDENESGDTKRSQQEDSESAAGAQQTAEENSGEQSQGAEQESASQQENGSEQADGANRQGTASQRDGAGESSEGESGEGESGEGESGEGESGEGESGEGESGEGESGEGESGEGESGEGESGAGESGAGESGAGESGAGESGAGESGAGESGAGESGAGESGAGESGAGESGAGESGAGESGAGESGAGESGAGESGAGESGAGESGAGESGAGESENERPTDRRTPSTQGENGGEPNRSNQGGGGSKVDNDGEAFEELRDYIEEKSSTPDQGSPQSSGNTAGSDSGQSQQQQQNNRGERKSGSEDRQSPRQGAGPSDRGDDAEQQQSKDPSQSSDASAESSQDESGGGAGNAGDQPPPPAEGEGQDRRKSGSSQQDSQQREEPNDGGISKRDSDSRQGEEGSRHGKGQEGGGQQSQQEGEGSAGTSTPSDAGKGAAPESGQGERGSGEGKAETSDRPTGQAGEQSGSGSTQASAESGTQDESSDRAGASSGSGSSDQAPPSNSDGGGSPSSAEQTSESATVEPGADQANLEYANKTTDLVLDYLQNQIDQGEIDSELKRRFGWTEQEFADFLNRYRNLRQQKRLDGQAGEEGRKEWEAVLRSLGLLPPQRNVSDTRLQKNKTTGLRESGRSRPPQEDQNRFDAFRKDVLAR